MTKAEEEEWMKRQAVLLSALSTPQYVAIEPRINWVVTISISLATLVIGILIGFFIHGAI